MSGMRSLPCDSQVCLHTPLSIEHECVDCPAFLSQHTVAGWCEVSRELFILMLLILLSLVLLMLELLFLLLLLLLLLLLFLLFLLFLLLLPGQPLQSLAGSPTLHHQLPKRRVVEENHIIPGNVPLGVSSHDDLQALHSLSTASTTRRPQP